MGQIADYLEKKALGTLSEDEKKQLDTLLKEAEMARTEEVQSENKSEDQQVEEMAQKLADSAQAKMASSIDALTKALEGANETKEVKQTETQFVIDKALGRNHSVEELSEIKVALPGRKQQGKEVTEVSQKTVEFFSALYSGDKQKLQILSEGTGADGGFLVPEEFANVII